MKHPTIMQIRIGIIMAISASLLLWGVLLTRPMPQVFEVVPYTPVVSTSTPSPLKPTPLPPAPPPHSPRVPLTLPYGSVMLGVGEVVSVGDYRIVIHEVLEDSRCPSDVMCVWAGMLRVRLSITGSEVHEKTLLLGDSVSVEGVQVELSSALPSPKAGSPVEASHYRLTLVVTPAPIATPPTNTPSPSQVGGCIVGGCSSQLCIESTQAEGMVSTCEYRESYACYRTATCERQASGACGWTPTTELTQCLATANSGGGGY
jgi:hypothetical protein